MTTVQQFLKSESGATAIEYGLLAGLVSVAAVAAMMTTGQSLTQMYYRMLLQVRAAYQ